LHLAAGPAGAMMAWAWGVSRLVDVIAQTPATKIDPTRLGVTGCSRNGKGALTVGAFDERIVLTIPPRIGLRHCAFPASEQPDVDAFVQKFLVGGGTASTAIMRTTSNFMYDATKWQDWTVPTLH
jgi:cephalosporin-C deacetylase-like acetyl esterase